MTRTILLVLSALAIGSAASVAGPAQTPPKLKEVTLTGQLVCLGCDLKSNYHAHAACSIYGHGHALKVAKTEKAADGKTTTTYLYYTFLINDTAKPLVDGEAFHGKTMAVKGVVFPGSQIVDVASYSEVKR